MSNRVCHFKLVLLGDPAVGKSCLVVRFVRDEFFEFQEPTIGGEAFLSRLIVHLGLLSFIAAELCIDLVLYMHMINIMILLCTHN